MYVVDGLLAQLRELETPAEPLNISGLLRGAMVEEIRRRRAGSSQVPDPAPAAVEPTDAD